jgi:hypothetical protein
MRKSLAKKTQCRELAQFPNGLRALEQLKNDGLVSEDEYDSKRKEILGEL